MKIVAKIIVYLLAAAALGALLAPRVFRLAHDMEQWALANRLMTWDPYRSDVFVSGPLRFITREFADSLAPALVLAALLLAMPASIWLDVTSARALRLARNRHRWQHLASGFAITAFLFGLLGFGLLLSNLRAVRKPVHPAQIVWCLVPSLLLACLAELIFRGVLFAALRRSLGGRGAWAWSTLFFAACLLFRLPSVSSIAHAGSLSGFVLLKETAESLRDPIFLLMQLGPALTLGVLLGYARQETDSLWLGIGLLWGALFAAFSFDSITVSAPPSRFWAGVDLLSGPLPVLAMAFALLLVYIRLAREDVLPIPPTRA